MKFKRIEEIINKSVDLDKDVRTDYRFHLIVEREDDFIITLNEEEARRILRISFPEDGKKMSVLKANHYRQAGMGGVEYKHILPEHRELSAFLSKVAVADERNLSVRKDQLHRLAIVHTGGYFVRALTVLPDVLESFNCRELQ